MIHKNWQELIKPSQISVNPGSNPEKTSVNEDNTFMVFYLYYCRHSRVYIDTQQFP